LDPGGWNALARVLDDGRYPIDNNPTENAIRPIVIGRQNWLFCGSESAGQRPAATKATGLAPMPGSSMALPGYKHLDSLRPTSWYCPPLR
jgi:hypothetical protein